MIDIEASIAELRDIWGQGPGIHKRPPDLARYEALIERVRPRVIVETGLYYGQSAVWFAERVPHVINVEINRETTADYLENRHGLSWPPPNASIVLGDSCAVFPRVKELTEQLAEGGPVMVVLDSNHDTETVYNEAMAYCDLVTVGSYLVVEDGLLHFLPQNPGGSFQGANTPHNWFVGDPWLATADFLITEQGRRFACAGEIEDMFPTTQHVDGWLRRVS